MEVSAISVHECTDGPKRGIFDPESVGYQFSRVCSVWMRFGTGYRLPLPPGDLVNGVTENVSHSTKEVSRITEDRTSTN